MSSDNRQGRGGYLDHDGGLFAWFSSIDHKRIAVSYLALILSVLLLGVSFAMVLRLELFSSSRLLLEPDLFQRLMTMHGLTLFLFCIIPCIPAVLGNFVLPLMLGTDNLAHPHLNRWALRLYLAGVILVLLAILAGAVNTGWELLPPFAIADRLPLILLGLGIHIIAFHLIFTGMNFLITIVRFRPDGVGWLQLPIMVWALLVTGLLQVLASPLLASMGLMLLVDVTGGASLFDNQAGGDLIAWRRFFWYFAHPAIFMALIPALGVVGEIFVTFCRKPLHAHRSSVIALVALGLLGLLGGGSHLVLGGQSGAAMTIFSALSLLAAVAGAVVLFNWLATLNRGAMAPDTPLVFGLAFMGQVTIGGCGALFLGMLSSSQRLSGTSFESGVWHYLLVGGVLTAFLAGLHYWWPKIFGLRYDEKWGRFSASLIFVGVNLAFVGNLATGFMGLRGGSYSYPSAFTSWQTLSGLGSLVLVLGLLTITCNLIYSLLKGVPAPGNPWGGSTLEWDLPSPPAADGGAHPEYPGLYDFSNQEFDASDGSYVRGASE